MRFTRLGGSSRPSARGQAIYDARAVVWKELGVVVEELKIIYSSIPRAANTAVKLALSSALGVDPERYLYSHWPHASQAAGVHNSALAPWVSIGQYESNQSPGKLPLRSRDWLWFATVRHPLPRLFSSWSLFLLSKEPHLEALGIDTDYPTVPRRLSDIPVLFSEFIFGSSIHALMKQDVHFAPQVDLLPNFAVEGSRVSIYRLEEVHKLGNDVDRHFRKHGLGELFSLERQNEGALTFSDFVWSKDVYSRCLELYEADFVAFGYGAYPESRPTRRSTEDIAIALLGEVRERHARIGALAKEISRISDLA